MSGPGYIAAEAPQQCDTCGKIAELRPYGPRGERICYDCARVDPVAAECGMGRLIFGESCTHTPRHGRP